MARKALRDICADRYKDEAVAQAVHDDAVKQGTADAILKGELVLPTDQDAVIWHRRVTGAVEEESERQSNIRRIQELEKAVATLTAASDTPQKDYIRKLEEVVRAYEKREGK
jgi:hypothetical protein